MKDKLSERVMVAVTPAEKSRLQKQSAGEGRTLAGHIRWILRQYMQGKEGEK